MKIFIALMLFATLAIAGDNDKLHTPKSFSANGRKAVFADFTEATYHINYDIASKKASVKAEIKLETSEAGFPIFDSVVAPTSVSFDGATVTTIETKTPNNETTLRLINKLAQAGVHTLTVEVPLTSLVEFSTDGVKSAFWTSDLDERKFLERYMPANFEFDQVKMTFLVKFIGAKNKQIIYTNGNVTEVETNSFKITYPNYYTASSIFFHAVPQGATTEQRFTLKSIDGREIPAVVYFTKSSWSASLDKLKAKTTEVFHELESDYGAFPHPSITVLQAGMGGMEYCGATMTDFSALGHELFHSYFARGVMPANGNAGWVDEALASWRDDGYQSLSTLSGSSGMSSHAYYTRTTDKAAYSFGERFMSYLDGKLQSKGGLKPFMRHMVDKKVFSPFFVEEFIKEMSDFYGVSLEADFKKYTYGSGNDFSQNLKAKSHIHRKMTIEEMQNFL
ncbi:MAG: hypothetical protein H0V66_07300 [Bdellovibrionales bacterium]|nr:hypothetical protein [Bdellovibrionales bacterium]